AFTARIGQARVAERTREHLGESDPGVLMMRKKMFEQIEAVRSGRDPLGTIRDPAINRRVHLPLIGDRPPGAGGDETGPPSFSFLARQPQEIVEELSDLWRTPPRHPLHRSPHPTRSPPRPHP